MKSWTATGIGLAVRDISVLVDDYPHADEKVKATQMYESCGGPVPTALVTLARFGRTTALASYVGNDDVGRFILKSLNGEGVQTEAVKIKKKRQSATSVIIVENGRRTILEPPDTQSFSLNWQDVRQLPLKQCRSLIVDARSIEIQIKAAKIVRQAGGLVVLDCGHPRKGVELLLEHTDIAIFSHTYATALFGKNYDTKLFLSNIFKKLPQDGPAICGLTLGEQGCALFSKQEPFFTLKPKKVKAVDSTGAGDVFHGAFIHAYLKTMSVQHAARFANISAAYKCEGLSGTASIPDEELIWSEV